MAKDRKKLQHIHSSVPDKQPTPSTLAVGEIAVNNAANQEFLSIRNSEDKVKRFSSDEQMITWVEKKEVIPYAGFTRGSDGPTGSTGPNSVTNDDLLQNKSNLIIKFNQVAASNTAKHDVVNGSKDIYNLDVNPTSDSGVTDGAGFAIDMSRYAMIGANPSFSSLTVTDKTDLSGNTTISDGDGSGTRTGNTLKIETTNVNASDSVWKETIRTKTEKINSRDTTVGTENLHISGTTTEVKDDAVTETNNSTTNLTRVGIVTEDNKNNVVRTTSGTTTETFNGAVTENYQNDFSTNVTGNTSMITTGNTSIHSDGSLGMSANGNVTVVSTESDIVLTANDDICATSGVKVSFEAPTTNIGLGCDDSASATTTNLYGTTTNLKSNTFNNNIAGNSTTNVGGNSVMNVTGNTTISTTGITTIESTGENSDICISAADLAAFRGGVTTNVGKNCADAGQTTTLNLNGNTINETGNTVNISATTNVNVSADTLCMSGKTSANLYAPNTKVGVSCAGTSATTVYVSGTTINEGGTTNNNTFTTVNNTATTINNNVTNYNISGTTNISGDTNITGNTNITKNLNVTGNTNITGATNISGATKIDDDLTVTGNLYLQVDCGSGITSSTVNAAICESMDRSVITMTKTTPAATSEILATYKLFQNGAQVGEDINIPKDHLLKDVSIVYGKADGSSFTACTSTASDCHWYIKLVWNVNDPSTGHSDDKITYLPADDFIKDIDDKNPTGVAADSSYNNVAVNVWYDGKQNWVSATTTPTIHASQNIYADGNISGTNITASTAIRANNVSANTITAATDVRANNVSANTLSAATSIATKDLNAGGNATVTGALTLTSGIAKKVSWQAGSFTADTTGYNGSADKVITVPTSIDHLTNWNGSCINLPHNVCVTGTITASGTIHSSDRDLKENINFVQREDFNKAKNIPIKSFNFKDDKDKNKMYGVIAQEVQDAGLDELVYTKDDGHLAVDYTSLMMLRIAYLEDFCAHLNRAVSYLLPKVKELEDKLNSVN